MPQMAPMNWLSLFIFFSVLFLTTNTLNFFSKNEMPIKMNSIKNKTSMNWKW